MPADLNDVASLRQRVLDSLTKKGGLPPSSLMDDDEIEEGEIQEIINKSVISLDRNFAPPTAAELPKSPLLHFTSGIPGLNMIKSNEKKVSISTAATMPSLQMPHDLPINFRPVHLNTLMNGQQPRPKSTARQTPPWEPTLSIANSLSGKRPLSQDSQANDRPSKRLGTHKHPALVISLESDEEDHVEQTKLHSEPANAYKRQDGAAKLRQVEADIAQAMAALNKAQQLQNARKLQLSRSSTPTNPNNKADLEVSMPRNNEESSQTMSGALPQVELATKPDPVESVTSAVVPSRDAETEIATLDASITTKKKELLSSRIEYAEVQRICTINDIRQSDCVELIAKLQLDLQLLQQQVIQQTVQLDKFAKEKSRLDSLMQERIFAQEQLARQIQAYEARRKVVQANLFRSRESIVKDRNYLQNPLDATNVALPSIDAPRSSNLASHVVTGHVASETVVGTDCPVATRSTTLQRVSQSPAESPFAGAPITKDVLAETIPRGEQWPVVPSSSSSVQPTPSSTHAIGSNHVPVNVGNMEVAFTTISPSQKMTAHDQASPNPVLTSQMKAPRANSIPNSNGLGTTPSTVEVRQLRPHQTSGTTIMATQRMSHSERVSHDPPEHSTNEGEQSSSLTNTVVASLPASASCEQSVTKANALPTTSSTILKSRSTAMNSLYVSPLTRFRTFKYHTQYAKTVSSGFRSSTYFHKISQDKILCKFETQGGICNLGTACIDQHFAQFLMTGSIPRVQEAHYWQLMCIDDEVLIELSCASIGQTAKAKHAYRDGLRSMLQKMKTENIDDFNEVCSRMIAYRRSKQEHANQSVSSFF